MLLNRLSEATSSPEVEAALEEAKAIAAYRHVQIYFISHYDSPDDAAAIANINESIHSVVHPQYFIEDANGALEPANMPYTTDKRPAVDYVGSFISCLQSDREDKLIATVVCDETGHCLGLVYSSDASIRVAFQRRQGVYWSRSQNRVWKKGDNSGCWQELLSIKHDCDGDALMFTVIQHGNPAAFCHLLIRSCWGPSSGIRKLEDLLKSRLQDAPEGSYTKRLFEDKDLLKRKLLIEANELFDSSDREKVAAEAADLMYFLMTRCISVGVGIRDIEANLDRRTLKINRPNGSGSTGRTGGRATSPPTRAIEHSESSCMIHDHSHEAGSSHHEYKK
jgi:phosphoribosyl-ATP pyrophosphohydrolase/phosphoribosyl-AMP cyclohydrolase/histidinol dehydrogenase